MRATAVPAATTNHALADFLASRGTRPTRAPSPRPVSSEETVTGQVISRPASPTASLDLTDPVSQATRARTHRAGLRPVARTRPGVPTILTSRRPTVTLTRLQTGIGSLSFTAVSPESAGDLRFGCAVQLRTGQTSTVETIGCRRSAPKNSRRPVIVGWRDQREWISVDLRQCRSLDRLVIYAFSETGAELRWAGALVVSTFGGATIEVPIEASPSRDVRVLLSLYNVRGEFVLRAEQDSGSASVREACQAYGFDRITWLDARTPVG